MNDLYVVDLATDQQVRTVVEGEAASTVGWVAEDDGLLYLRTNLGAPNWRLAVADPTDPLPPRWRDLIPESEHPLTRAFPTRDVVVAMYEVDATNRVTIHDRATGERRAEVAASWV